MGKFRLQNPSLPLDDPLAILLALAVSLLAGCRTPLAVSRTSLPTDSRPTSAGAPQSPALAPDAKQTEASPAPSLELASASTTEDGATDERAEADASMIRLASQEEVAGIELADDDTFPIDLSQALAMGGAGSLQIQLARERVIEAHAELQQARALWLPSLRFGIGWNKHDGRLQATPGQVSPFSRNSLFVGGGAGLGEFPLTGGASGPARLMVSLSLADAIFAPRVARRTLDAQNAAEAATVVDTLVEIAVAYFDLVEAHGRLANAHVGLESSGQMLELVRLHAREGSGSEMEVDRAKTEDAYWRQTTLDAGRQTVVRSARLARLLRLEPTFKLVPAEDKVVPLDLVPSDMPLEALVAQGLSSRPELAQYQAMVEASLKRFCQEKWRPWLPNVQVGASGGTFGGGPETEFDNQGTRSDVDLLAVWEMRNMGYGEVAQRSLRASQFRQSQLRYQWIQDGIVAEIAAAAEDVASYREQLDVARESVVAAGDSFRRNLQLVRDAEGLPIELLQAIRARTSALDAYTQAVADYNRAQYRLIRAIGQPPHPK